MGVEGIRVKDLAKMLSEKADVVFERKTGVTAVLI